MTENQVLAKLRMKSGQRAVVLGAPDSYLPILAEQPAGVEMAKSLEGTFDFIHCFATS